MSKSAPLSLWLHRLALAGLFLLGLAIRLYDLTDPPLDFNAPRQLHSAVIARGMYYQHLDSAPEWQRRMAVDAWKAEGLIEPQILEAVTALTYRLAGSEQVWVARLYSIFFWMAGAAALWLLARRMHGAAGALAAAAYFLVLPFGALASRSFQPDPLMTALILFAWWRMAAWSTDPNWKNTLLAGLFSGAAILVKSTAVFFIAPAWAGVILGSMGLRAALRDRRVWAAAALSVFPYACYHVYGVYISGEMAQQFQGRFFPALWIDPVFYLRWNTMIASTAGFEWFWLALVCAALAAPRPLRGLLWGAWAGYFLYGMTFSYHISTHDYYQLPVLGLVALGLAGGVRILVENLKEARRVALPILVLAALFIITVKAWDVRVTLKRDDYRQEVQFWQKLGRCLGDDASVVGLLHDYGFRLYYYGWVRSAAWKTSADFNYRGLSGVTYDMQELFQQQIEGRQYFVVTLFDELERQPELKSLLYGQYPYEEDSSGYVIFDLSHRK